MNASGPSLLNTLYQCSYQKFVELKELDELIQQHKNRNNVTAAQPLIDARAVLAQVYLDDAKLLQQLRAEALAE